jgi:hypothetical protein
VTRNFTRTELQQNLPGENYHETCPNLPALEGSDGETAWPRLARAVA